MNIVSTLVAMPLVIGLMKNGTGDVLMTGQVRITAYSTHQGRHTLHDECHDKNWHERALGIMQVVLVAKILRRLGTYLVFFALGISLRDQFWPEMIDQVFRDCPRFSHNHLTLHFWCLDTQSGRLSKRVDILDLVSTKSNESLYAAYLHLNVNLNHLHSL